MGKKKLADVVEKKTKKELSFELTKQEREQKLEELLALEKGISNKKAEIAKFKNAIQDEIKESVAQRSKLSRHLEDNCEPRVVECIARFDYSAGRVSFIHKTKVMEEREIWEHERQETLPLEPKKTKKKRGKNVAPVDSDCTSSDIAPGFGDTALSANA